MNLRGSLPLLILHTLSRGPSHGYHIAKHIRARSEGTLDFKEGSLYPALHKLEKEGAIEAFEQDQNGRTRRYYQLSDAGRGQLEAERQTWADYSQAVNLVLEQST